MFDRFTIMFTHAIVNEDGAILRGYEPIETCIKVSQTVGYTDQDALKFLAQRLAAKLEDREGAVE